MQPDAIPEGMQPDAIEIIIVPSVLSLAIVAAIVAVILVVVPVIRKRRVHCRMRKVRVRVRVRVRLEYNCLHCCLSLVCCTYINYTSRRGRTRNTVKPTACM